jgi:ABC-2 type transport system permease protein
MQGVLFMLVAPLVNISLSAIPAALGMLALVAFGLTALGYVIAWKMDSTQGFHAIMNLFLIPMWLLSGSVFPASGAPGWLRWVILVNPLTYGLAAVRTSIYGIQKAASMNLPSFAVSLGISIAFAGCMFASAIFLTRRTST